MCTAKWVLFSSVFWRLLVPLCTVSSGTSLFLLKECPNNSTLDTLCGGFEQKTLIKSKIWFHCRHFKCRGINSKFNIIYCFIFYLLDQILLFPCSYHKGGKDSVTIHERNILCRLMVHIFAFPSRYHNFTSISSRGWDSIIKCLSVSRLGTLCGSMDPMSAADGLTSAYFGICWSAT